MNSLDLRILLLALRDRLIDPTQLAQVGLKWDPTQGPLSNYLLDSQLLNPEQFQKLTEALENTPVDQLAQPPSTLADQKQQENRGKLEAPSTKKDEPSTPADEFAMTRGFQDQNATAATTPNVPLVLPQGGRYIPETFHRRGGLGQIWQARDTWLGRMVALKSIREDRTAANAVSMFINEARLTSRLEHPCIVPLYDYVPAVGNEGPWYVMKFVCGETLQEATQAYHERRLAKQSGPLDLARLLDAMIRVCQAVAFAHERGVLHRDLKGQNVILGEFGEVFLLDWGLAKQLKDADPSSPNSMPIDPDRLETKLGEVVGTPGYISPQVIAGQQATKLSDIYGLGAILYTILTGQSPAMPSEKRNVFSELGYTPPPEPQVINPSTPAALQAICLKAMAEQAEDRYQSATELATELQRWLAGEPVGAYAEPLLAKVGRWANRHRTRVAAAIAILTTAFLASLVTIGLVWREERATAAAYELAVKNAERADQERARVVVVSRDLAIRTSDIAMGRISETSDRHQFAKRQSLVNQLDLLHQQDPADTEITQNLADMQRLAGGAARSLNEIKIASAYYEAAIQNWKDLRAIAPENSRLEISQAVTILDYAAVKERTGNYIEATQMHGQVLDLLDAASKHGANPNDVKRARAMCLTEMAVILHETGQYEAADEHYRRSLKLAQELQEFNGADAPKQVDQFWLAICTKAHAELLRTRKKWPEAMMAHAEAMNLLETLAPNISTDRDRVIHSLLARLDRAGTLGKLPAGTTAAASIMQAIDIEVAVTGFEVATMKYVDSRLYREFLCAAYLARGQNALDRQQYDAADSDINKAAKLMIDLRSHTGKVSNFRLVLAQIAYALASVYDAKKNLPERDHWFDGAKSLVGIGAPALLYEDNFMYQEIRAKLMKAETKWPKKAQAEAKRANDKRP